MPALMALPLPRSFSFRTGTTFGCDCAKARASSYVRSLPPCRTRISASGADWVRRSRHSTIVSSSLRQAMMIEMDVFKRLVSALAAGVCCTICNQISSSRARRQFQCKNSQSQRVKNEGYRAGNLLRYQWLWLLMEWGIGSYGLSRAWRLGQRRIPERLSHVANYSQRSGVTWPGLGHRRGLFKIKILQNKKIPATGCRRICGAVPDEGKRTISGHQFQVMLIAPGRTRFRVDARLHYRRVLQIPVRHKKSVPGLHRGRSVQASRLNYGHLMR